jgi:preprotein translocase subunit SecG
MFTILMVLASIISILLMIIVLLQSSKGGGLAGTFGGSNMGTMFGTRRTADFLSKATWWLGGGLAVLALFVNLFFLPGSSTASQRESIIQGSSNQNIPSTPTLPPQGQLPTQQNNGQQQQGTQDTQNPPK